VLHWFGPLVRNGGWGECGASVGLASFYLRVREIKGIVPHLYRTAQRVLYWRSSPNESWFCRKASCKFCHMCSSSLSQYPYIATVVHRPDANPPASAKKEKQCKSSVSHGFRWSPIAFLSFCRTGRDRRADPCAARWVWRNQKSRSSTSQYSSRWWGQCGVNIFS
jgi:hypothetical protein